MRSFREKKKLNIIFSLSFWKLTGIFMDKFLFPLIIAVCSEADVFSNTLDIVSDVEWNPATKLLSQVT